MEEASVIAAVKIKYLRLQIRAWLLPDREALLAATQDFRVGLLELDLAHKPLFLKLRL